MPGYPQILLFMCSNCKGMIDKLLPEVQLQFSKNLKVLPISCPSQIDPLAFIKILKKCCEGIIVACPKDACCCPENKKVIKRREMVKDILPVFGLHKEQFQVASVSPFAEKELIEIIEQMLTFLKMSGQPFDEYNYVESQNKSSNLYKWVN
ncbi:MAG: hypothetical protein CVV03_01135 [Firmicutes bacterium HGW-Firmicutes-8]|nr:MAG: hypothetical protein CVV03_01135 [Firmicutes bacterium HGW-Firmicutes-8]